MKNLISRLPSILPFVVLSALVLGIPYPVQAAPQTHHLTLDMMKSEFSPGRFQVSEGDTIVLTLKASDVVHGFYLDGYGIEQRVEPGIDQQLTFVATQRGKFRYRCSVSCGAMHPFMIGELIVGPNLLFWRVIGLTLIALVATLVTFRHETPTIVEV